MTLKNAILPALGIFGLLFGACRPASAAAIGISSIPGNPVAIGADQFDALTLHTISSTNDQIMFSATLIGGNFILAPTSAFAYFTDPSNIIRDVLYINLADNGVTSTLYFNYIARGNFGTVGAPTGIIADPKTSATVNLASLPHIAGVSEADTRAPAGGYVVNPDLRNASTGSPSTFVPFLAVYLFAGDSGDVSAETIPEPSSFLLFAAGLGGVVLLRRRSTSK